MCAAADSYAVYDFKKFDAYTKGEKGKYAYKVLEAGASDDEPAKFAIIYAICGKAFKPDASKLNTDKAKVIADMKSCNDLATDATTKGNMYLLKDGKCVQSFHYADFKATIEQQEDKSISQKWDMTYTST